MCFSNCIRQSLPALGFLAVAVIAAVLAAIVFDITITIVIPGLAVIALASVLAKIIGGAVFLLIVVAVMLIGCALSCIGKR